MKGDFTRATFRPEKHYSRVLQQQGRVQLDSDWNEALDILTHRHRMALIDIIGRCGGPDGQAGFEITVANGVLSIGNGSYYVDGILVEKDDDDQAFTAQSDLPDAPLPDEPGRFLFYLDVWERHITALEDPNIREVALGGPDTATRTQVLGQVKWQPLENGGDCDDFEADWQPDGAASTGTLAARAQPTDDDDEPCIIPPGAGYSRLENQLYRVEIYQGGTLGDPANEPTFTYSRENGSVVAGLIEIDANTLTVSAEGRDDNLSFHPTDWVEINNDSREVQGRRGILVQLSDVEGRELTIDPTTAIFPNDLNAIPSDIDQFGPNPKVRRWESDGAEPVQFDPTVNDGFLQLESGVEVLFGNGDYQTGDYWLIPARTNIGDVLWPVDTVGDPIPELAHGIKHHYCALALATLTLDPAQPAGIWTNFTDCRCIFSPLCDLPQDVVTTEGSCCCCGFSVGDGRISTGDFDSIEAAVEAIVAEGGSGHICLLYGTHQLESTLEIEGLEITIIGCGWRSMIISSARETALSFLESRVRLEDLVIQASAANIATINLTSCSEVVIENCEIVAEVAGSTAIYFNDCERVLLRDCLLRGTPAVVSASRNVQLLDNRARGGFWLEQGSIDVVVAGNDLRDGNLQGITLGGARIEPLTRETPVQRITIRENQITGMNQSAIGSAILTPRLEVLGQIRSLVISQNRLRENATGQRNDRFDGPTLGGIVLHGVLEGIIQENIISHNGLGEVPACGICLSWATDVEIKDNHITGNGQVTEPGTIIETDRLQGGIFLLPVLGGTTDLDFRTNEFIQPGRPAFQVHDNVVVTPAGPCLIAYGYGPMSIRDNSFTSQAIVIQPPLEDAPTDEFGQHLFGATNVSVFNLALNAGRRTKALPAGGGIVFVRDDLLGILQDFILSAEEAGFTPAGQIAYHGNQSDQTGHRRSDNQETEDPSISLVSFGDVAAQDNQSVCRAIDRGEIQLADWRVLAETTRVQNNWIEETPGDPEHTLFSIVAFGQLFCHTSHNQVSECIYAAGVNVQEIGNQVLANLANLQTPLTDNDIVRICEPRRNNFEGLLPPN